MNKKETYKLLVSGNHVKIYINNLIHIQFRCDEFVGIQSTIEGTNWFSIILYLKCGQKIWTEYDSKERWMAILKLIDESKL